MPDSQDQPLSLPGSQPPTAKRMAPHKKVIYVALVAAVILGGAALGIWYWRYAESHEWTDDAFIDGHITQVSSRVPGRVVKVLFDDNQQVKQGDKLVEIDPRDFDVRVAQARAALESATHQQKTAEVNVTLVRTVTAALMDQAKAGVEQSRAGLAMAKAGLQVARFTAERAKATVAAAEADAVRTAADLKRFKELSAENRISPQQMDGATAVAQAAAAQHEAAKKAYDAAMAGVTAAEAQITQTEGKLAEYVARLAEAGAAPDRIAVAESQRRTATSEVARLRKVVEQAELEHSYTEVLAPETGRMARKTVEVGDFLQPGQGMASLVQPDVWVVANFKETAVGRLRVGQTVALSADAYPGKVFKGRVASIQPGSGSVFSLLPPENATGNYVKIVQRVPVKIVFDDPPDPAYPLSPGMSVVPVVEIAPGADTE
jgi:membrane fusion protein (multidrug efflux system)